MVMRCGPVRRANFHSVNGSYAHTERTHASWCGHSVHVKARGDTELHMGMEALEEAVGGGIEPRSHSDGLAVGREGGLGGRLQDPKRRRKEGATRVPLAVARMESLVSDGARLVEDEDTGIWQVHVARARLDAIDSVIFLHVFIDEAELTNDAATLVGEQRKADAVLVRKAAKYLDGVVADGEEGDAFGLETRPHLLQLDQLRLAEGSPLGAAVEDYERLAVPACRVQILHSAALVRQTNIGKALAFPGTYRRELSRTKGHEMFLPLETASGRRP